ncbi:MAG: DUF2304 domain-containing protein [Lactobacillales bacterium]|nr:DUF2304 domain-containing protein [Lactobacillales bacterium]
MEYIFSIEMILLVLFFFYFIVRRINTEDITPSKSVMWLILCFCMAVIAFAPKVATFLAHLFHFELTSNFVLMVGVIVLLIQGVYYTIDSSQQQKKITRLVQEVSLLKADLEEKEKKKEGKKE